MHTETAHNPAADATLAAATGIVKAMVEQTPGLTPAQALELLEAVHARMLHVVSEATSGLARATGQAVTPPRPAEPAVPIESSVREDSIVCLEDGTEHVMMKRYLKRVYGLTPEEYRARWNLPHDYPMTAPGYSARKRNEAYEVRLGTSENKRGLGKADFAREAHGEDCEAGEPNAAQGAAAEAAGEAEAAPVARRQRKAMPGRAQRKRRAMSKTTGKPAGSKDKGPQA